MVSNLRGTAAVAGSTFVLWALVAASAVYWGLRFSSGPGTPPAPVAPRGPAPIDPSTIARLLGSAPSVAAAAPSAASRFALTGVAVTGPGQGAALIAVDGKPAKPYRVGSPIDENLVLQSVEPRRATLGPPNGAATVTLDLPVRAGQAEPPPAVR